MTNQNHSRREFLKLGAAALGGLALASCTPLRNISGQFPKRVIPETTWAGLTRDQLRASHLEDVADKLYCAVGRAESIVDGNTIYTTVSDYEKVAKANGIVKVAFERPLAGHRFTLEFPDGRKEEYFQDVDGSVDFGKFGVVSTMKGASEVRKDMKKLFGQEVKFNLSPSKYNNEGIDYGRFSVANLRRGIYMPGLGMPKRLSEIVAGTGIGNDARYIAMVKPRNGKTFVLFATIEEATFGKHAGLYIEHRDVVTDVGSDDDLHLLGKYIATIAGISSDASKFTGSAVAIDEDSQSIENRIHPPTVRGK